MTLTGTSRNDVVVAAICPEWQKLLDTYVFQIQVRVIRDTKMEIYVTERRTRCGNSCKNFQAALKISRGENHRQYCVFYDFQWGDNKQW